MKKVDQVHEYIEGVTVNRLDEIMEEDLSGELLYGTVKINVD